MSNITVNPGEWVEVFDEFTDGKFRIYSMPAKVKRSATLPTDGGVSVSVTETTASELMTNTSDGKLKLYVFNSGRTSGFVERDI